MNYHLIFFFLKNFWWDSVLKERDVIMHSISFQWPKDTVNVIWNTYHFWDLTYFSHIQSYLTRFFARVSVFFFVYLVGFNTENKHCFLTYFNTCAQQQNNYITQRFHLLTFPCLLRRMVLQLLTKTENNFLKDTKIY